MASPNSCPYNSQTCYRKVCPIHKMVSLPMMGRIRSYRRYRHYRHHYRHRYAMNSSVKFSAPVAKLKSTDSTKEPQSQVASRTPQLMSQRLGEALSLLTLLSKEQAGVKDSVTPSVCDDYVSVCTSAQPSLPRQSVAVASQARTSTATRSGL